MSTPFSTTSLVRWRIKDWASCFYTCRLPVDDEPKGFCCSSLKIYSGDNKGNEDDENDKELSKERSKKERKMKDVSSGNDDEGVEPSPLSFDEEDYIVFCFEEDGAIHMVNEMKSEPSNRIARLNSRRKVKISYSENGKKVKESIHEAMSDVKSKDIHPTNDEQNYVVSSDHKGKEKSINRMNAKPLPDAKEMNVIEATTECKDVSAERNDSSGQSDSSTSSFAFPVLEPNNDAVKLGIDGEWSENGKIITQYQQI